MVNVVVEPKSALSTAPYDASDPIQDNWGADWRSRVTTSVFRGTLPSAFEQAEDYFETKRQKLELDITQEFEFADNEATSLIDKTK